jgi:predicted RNase H-like nuclease
MSRPSQTIWVAGVDGCPFGWLAVFRSMTGDPPRARLFKSIKDVVAAPERPVRVAVDIPIGLSAVSEKGGRLADREARKVLRLRKSSIFPAPSRPVLQARSAEEAREIEHRNSMPPKKLAKQVYFILPKIRELDAIAESHLGIIFECHPEVSFWAMNDRTEMPLPKKSSKGLADRHRILARHNYGQPFLTGRLGSHQEHSRDDLLDACAAAWTAERILKRHALRFPANPDLDDRGLDMAIWA